MFPNGPRMASKGDDKNKINISLTFAEESDVCETLGVPEVREGGSQVGAEAVPFQAVLLLLGVHARAASDTCPVQTIKVIFEVFTYKTN